MTKRHADTYALVILGLDHSPEQLLNNAGFDVNKVYPVEGFNTYEKMARFS